MTHPLKKAFQDSGVKFKWGGQGNSFVYYKTPDMKVFRMMDGYKDGARVAKDLRDVDDYTYEDIHDVAMQVAWTWDNHAKRNDYSTLTPKRDADRNTIFRGV